MEEEMAAATLGAAMMTVALTSTFRSRNITRKGSLSATFLKIVYYVRIILRCLVSSRLNPLQHHFAILLKQKPACQWL